MHYVEERRADWPGAFCLPIKALAETLLTNKEARFRAVAGNKPSYADKCLLPMPITYYTSQSSTAYLPKYASSLSTSKFRDFHVNLVFFSPMSSLLNSPMSQITIILGSFHN